MGNALSPPGIAVVVNRRSAGADAVNTVVSRTPWFVVCHRTITICVVGRRNHTHRRRSCMDSQKLMRLPDLRRAGGVLLRFGSMEEPFAIVFQLQRERQFRVAPLYSSELQFQYQVILSSVSKRYLSYRASWIFSLIDRKWNDNIIHIYIRLSCPVGVEKNV